MLTFIHKFPLPIFIGVISFILLLWYPWAGAVVIVVYYIFTPNTEPQQQAQSNSQSTTYHVGDMFMPATEKQIYLMSPQWERLRRMVRARDISCQVCGSRNRLEVHHTTYIRLGDEKLEDLKLVCRKCHQKIHDKYGYDRTTKYPIKE